MSAVDFHERAAVWPTEPRLTARVVPLSERIFDRGVAALLIMFLAVPMLVIAVAIKLSSRGPVFYRQVRLGRGGAPFVMWKFRTMVDGADLLLLEDLNEADGLLFKIRSDPRVTALGRLLRRWSLDELPQLANVIRGHMSVVGPRPLPVPLEAYDAVAIRRLAVKPGITGLWQVSGRSDMSWEECLQLDLAYVESGSLALDLWILLRTAGAVLRRAGAY